MTERLEHFLDLIISHGVWDVFDVNVIDDREDVSGLFHLTLDTNS